MSRERRRKAQAKKQQSTAANSRASRGDRAPTIPVKRETLRAAGWGVVK